MLGQLSFSRWATAGGKRILALIGMAIASGAFGISQSFVPGRSASALDALASARGRRIQTAVGRNSRRHRLGDEMRLAMRSRLIGSVPTRLHTNSRNYKATAAWKIPRGCLGLPSIARPLIYG